MTIHYIPSLVRMNGALFINAQAATPDPPNRAPSESLHRAISPFGGGALSLPLR